MNVDEVMQSERDENEQELQVGGKNPAQNSRDQCYPGFKAVTTSEWW